MYVYVIKQDIPKGHVKIGVSDSPTTRLKQLQTGSSVPLVLEGLIVCNNKAAAFILEKSIHRNFPELRLEGEWFNYTFNLRNYLRGVASSDNRKQEKALGKHQSQVARGHFKEGHFKSKQLVQ